MKRCHEESSPSDASTPKERGKMRTYLWACLLTSTPQPNLLSPCLCKIKTRRSSKMVRIVAMRTTRYSLILMLCYNVFIFVVKQVPSDEDLEWLSQKLDEWKRVGRRLKIEEARLTAFDNENKEWSEKIYKVLLHWKERDGSAATYTVLHDALCHPLVNRRDLAEQLITGNISPILQFN